MPRYSRSLPRIRSSASTTTWARRPCRTSWHSASPTACGSRSGARSTSTTCRSRSPRRSASRAAPATTRTPAPCATWCRTTCCSWWRWWRWRRRRRLHRHQRHQLQHVVLHHVAQGAGVLVVAGAALDADRLGDRDLHVVDVLRAPDRLPQAVGEAECQDVLHGLLAQVVVDAEDLILGKDLEYLGIEYPGTGQVVPERLLDHQAGPPSVALRRGEAGLADVLHDRG